MIASTTVTAPESLRNLCKGGTVLKVIQDVAFLVNRCDDQINNEFKEFLGSVGCSTATIAQAGY